MLFQSTLPMQGETRHPADYQPTHLCFNPLSLCRERPYASPLGGSRSTFQSTLPMQGETNLSAFCFAVLYKFQSTLPMQGETRVVALQAYAEGVSIHSPYAGRDTSAPSTRASTCGFNPLSLCRERLGGPISRDLLTRVSIHSPYAGRD